MTTQDLISILENFYNRMEKNFNENPEEFKGVMLEFIKYLKDTLLLSYKGYSQTSDAVIAYNNLTTNYKKEYFELRKKFRHAEHHFERLMEIQENERSAGQDSISLDKFIEAYISNEFNNLFYTDAKSEIEDLQEHYSEDATFLMVGSGSFPSTLLLYCQKYPQGTFIGIDNSSEAIWYAKRLANRFKVSNLSFDIIDGIDFDYRNVSTVFIANSVKPKQRVLNQIASSAKSGTKVIVRVPYFAGHLISEDVNYYSLPRLKFIEKIELKRENLDSAFYTRVVLQIG